jgi:hypothetical protein
MMLPDSFIAETRAACQNLVVFAVMRNEALRLPAWLRHYRRIGVKLFAVVDNGSQDATHEILSAQDDVVLTRIEGSFNQSNFGVDWLNEFRQRIIPGTWVLFADADECLVYRGWPDRSLPNLIEKMAAENCNAIFGFLLDMYPRGPLEKGSPSNCSDLFDVARCFDLDYHFRLRPCKPWESHRSVEIIGGPRVRLLSSYEREIHSTWVDYWLRGQIDRILPHVPDSLVPFTVRRMPRQMPALSKVPLAIAGSGFQYIDNHGGTGARLFPENVVICHFKFLADFAERVRQEAARQEHYRRGAEYIMYADVVRKSKSIDLSYEGSCEFEGADQLVNLNLIRDIRDLLQT